jgi:serine/threonine-protein kinase HipA
MKRREAQLARASGRPERRLLESDYLLGVHDGHRLGALRFRTEPEGPFLDDEPQYASPPWTSLRELEAASLALERDDAADDPEYARWLRLLIAPGGSLGGARPKASVVDEHGQLWIAKFPSRKDSQDVGAWEGVVHELAGRAGILISPGHTRSFGSSHRTFLTQRFDRTARGERIHVASAMTLLQRQDGDDAATGASYLELVEMITQVGARPDADLEELWRRIAFFVCVSNTDDHLRNHAFYLTPTGWTLAPAYDMNANPDGSGLTLNISETDNALDLALVRDVAPFFRVNRARADAIVVEVAAAVAGWRRVADDHGIDVAARRRFERAFAAAQIDGQK